MEANIYIYIKSRSILHKMENASNKFVETLETYFDLNCFFQIILFYEILCTNILDRAGHR